MDDPIRLTDDELETTTCVNPSHWEAGRVGDTSAGFGHVGTIITPCVQPTGEVPSMYAFASERWAGLAKLVEEAGELGQVMGKIMAVNGSIVHWEGGPLDVRLMEEMADVTAAIEFVLTHNDLDESAFNARVSEKAARFKKWAANGDRPPA